MAFVKVRVPRTSQPQDACGIDWSNPLTKALIAVYDYGPAGDPTVNLANPSGRKLGNYGVTKAVTPLGISLNLSNSYLRDSTQSPITGAPLTIACFNRALSLGQDKTLVTINVGDWYAYVYSLYHAAGLGLTAQTYDGSNAVARIGSSQQIGTWYFSAGVWESNSIRKVIQNDVSVSNTASMSAASGLSSFCIGVSPWSSPDSIWDGDILIPTVWARALSDAELASFRANPWQIFEPEEQLIWIPDAASTGLTAVYADAYAAYLIRNAAAQDLSAAYSLRGSASADLAPGYNIRTSAAKDITPAYSVRGAAQIDLSAAYSLRGAVQADESSSYVIRGAVGADLTPAYDIMSAGAVTSDLSPAYAVRGIALADITPAYSVRTSVQGDLASSYMMRGAVVADLSPNYAVDGAISAVQADLSVSYVVGLLPSTGPTAADIAAAVWAYTQ